MTGKDLILTIKYEICQYQNKNKSTPSEIVISKNYLNEIEEYYEDLKYEAPRRFPAPSLACLFGLEIVPITAKNFIMIGEKVENFINKG